MKCLHVLLLLIFILIASWSAIAPFERVTWWLETIPCFAALALLAATYRSFPLSNLAYVLILLHCIVLFIGGHYTYAEVPLFNWVRDHYGFARNSYDGLGHFVQGFVPAIIARELLLRTSPIKPGKWLFFIIIFACLGISAAYELLEAAVAMAAGEEANAFLGTQGDVWDTQKDMALAFIGAVAALLGLSTLHNRSLKKLG